MYRSIGLKLRWSGFQIRDQHEVQDKEEQLKNYILVEIPKSEPCKIRDRNKKRKH